jgi:hypothetical protein
MRLAADDTISRCRLCQINIARMAINRPSVISSTLVPPDYTDVLAEIIVQSRPSSLRE